MRWMSNPYFRGLAALRQTVNSSLQAITSHLKAGGMRLRQWYWYYVHSPNNPVDRAARQTAQHLYRGIQKVARGSAVAGRRILALLLSMLGALGLTLIVSYFADPFIEGLWPSRVIVASVFIASVATLLAWFTTAPTVGGLIGRFRLTIVTEFLVFGLLGLLVAATSLYALFD